MSADLIDPFILDSWVRVAAERGLTLDEVAAQVESESALLAAALRGLSPGARESKPKRRERAVKRG